MHRHGYKGRKLSRKAGQRKTLMKVLADDFIMYEQMTTTLPKAKELLPYVEKLITKAKKGGLHNWRLVRKKLTTDEATHKLFEEIAPVLMKRNGGYLRIIKHEDRKGDNAKLAHIEFVDDDKLAEQATKITKSKTEKEA